METKSWIMLRVLLNRFHEGDMESVLHGLPEDDARTVLSQDVVSKELFPAVARPQELIKRIHYSWIAPEIKKLPSNMQTMILSALPEEYTLKVSQFLEKEPPPMKLSSPIKSFVLGNLYSKILPKEVLPPEYLPESPLSFLGTTSKKELLQLFDFLGMYDLAKEIRHIVDKEKLKKIYQCITPKRREFLRFCLHQPEKLVSEGLKLERWDGDCNKLRRLLHRKGMMRLAYAVSGQHPDLMWHIIHTLDTGRGEIISKNYSKEEIAGITPVLSQQLLTLMNFLKKKGKL